MEDMQATLNMKQGWRDMSLVDCFILIILAVGIVAVSLHRAKIHLLWPDEVLSYRLLAAPSVKSMLRGWYEGADGGGLLYYLFARVWTMLFGLSELTLRLFSTFGMVISIFFIWLCGRRFATPLIVVVAVSVVYLIPIEFLWQASDGRFYGIFLASAAQCSYLFLFAAEKKPTPSLLLWTAVAHTLLVGSHILGVVYSGFLVLGMFFVGKPREKLPIAISAACGWLLVPLSWHAARASASIAVRPFEVPSPALDDLITGPTMSDPFATGILATLLALFVVSLFRAPRQAGVSLMPRSGKVLLLCSLGAMLTLFIKSQVGVPVFRERYLFPVTIATTILMVCLIKAISPASWLRPLAPLSTALLASCLLIPAMMFAAFRPMKEDIYPSASLLDAAAVLPKVPIVMTHFSAYNVLSHYDHNHRYLYMLNWQYDLAPGRHLADYSSERLMENVTRAEFDRGSVLSCHDIVTHYPDFILITESRRREWMEGNLIHNPAYTVQRREDFPQWRAATAWSVHRVSRSSAPC